MPKRLATDLHYRGRSATGIRALGFGGFKDPRLLENLEQLGPVLEWVLVTGDDAMPWEHGEIIKETGATVATIDPRRADAVLQHAWRRDVVHRWAHAMQIQKAGTVRRYSLSRSGLWAPRKRHLARGI